MPHCNLLSPNVILKRAGAIFQHHEDAHRFEENRRNTAYGWGTGQTGRGVGEQMQGSFIHVQEGHEK
jgi:hypothetical protein